MKRTLVALILLLAAISAPASYGETQDVFCQLTKSTPHKGVTVAQPTTVATSLPVAITFVTNCGEITIAVNSKSAPFTVTSLSALALGSYYDNSLCHRITTSGLFVIQCGDPTATGSGQPAGWEGYIDENLPRAVQNNYPTGTVAMANSGAATNGAQFFIVTKDTTLNPSYSIWGSVVSGMAIVNYVAAKGATQGVSDGQLSQPLEIEKVILRDSAWFATFSAGRNEAVRVYEEKLAAYSDLAQENLSLKAQIANFVNSSNNQLLQIRELQSQLNKLQNTIASLSKQGSTQTITCVKGKLTQKVTGINPKCPTGYKKN